MENELLLRFYLESSKLQDMQPSCSKTLEIDQHDLSSNKISSLKRTINTDFQQPATSKLREALSEAPVERRNFDVCTRPTCVDYKNQLQTLLVSLYAKIDKQEQLINGLQTELIQRSHERDSYKIMYEGAQVENRLLKGTTHMFPDFSLKASPAVSIIPDNVVQRKSSCDQPDAEQKPNVSGIEIISVITKT